MKRVELAVVGVPSSAGARRSGQERAPAALRVAGLIERLRAAGIEARDRKDVAGAEFRPDREHPRRQNLESVLRVARDVAAVVHEVEASGAFPLVLGGDCTISLGVVSGLLAASGRLGVVYFDADLDLNTPETTISGIFDGMVTAHLLGQGARELAELGPRRPLVEAERLLYFGYSVAGGGIEPPELLALERCAALRVPIEAVREHPAATARSALADIEARADRILVHFDLDVTDTTAVDVPHAGGLPLDGALEALGAFLASAKCAGLVVTEHNPALDADGAATRQLAEGLAETLATAWMGAPRD